MSQKLTNIGKFRPRIRIGLPAESNQLGNVFIAIDFLL